MRQKKEAVPCFASNDDGLPKVERDYRARYRTISQVLGDNSGILDTVHRDIKPLSQGGRQGRKGDFTPHQVNELLGRYGVAKEAINLKVIRTDTTVVESNIHYPTDPSPLWDTSRVATPGSPQ